MGWDKGAGTFLLAKALVLLSSSSSSSLATAVDSLAILAAFLFSASNLACNFLSTGSFEGPTLVCRETFAPKPSLQRLVMLQHKVGIYQTDSKKPNSQQFNAVVIMLTFEVDPPYPHLMFHRLQICSYFLPIPQPTKKFTIFDKIPHQ
jgi:hypothetical protein